MADDVHSLAAAYSLDALDPEERRAFEAHYAGCETCRTEVREYRETAARLGVTNPTPLPVGLKDRVLAEAARTRQLPPLVAAPAPSATQPVGTSHRRRWARPALVAAAVLLVVAIAGGVAAVVRAGSDGGTGGGELAAVMSAPDAVTVDLRGDGEGTLRLVYSRDRGRAVVVGSDLEDPGDGRTYQMWMIDGDAATPAGVFRPSASGAVDASIDVPAADPAAWGVTVEPDGGSTSPTGDVLFQGTPT